MGLGIVVFYFTFIPGYQTTIQLRQVKVAWLYARANHGLANFTLVDWFILSGANDWTGLWEDWESLVPQSGREPWADASTRAAAAVALDSASFYLSAIEPKGAPSATVCHRTGVDALRLITAELADRRATPEMPGGRRLTGNDFDIACDRFAGLGAKVMPEREACWLRFVELRGEYEAELVVAIEGLISACIFLAHAIEAYRDPHRG